MENKKYFIGLDIGTNSIGYAVTDEEYKPLKYKGEAVMGTHIFEEAMDGQTRRTARTARRRLDRRQFRVKLVQELFENEIYKIDPKFFQRRGESALWRDEVDEPYTIFCDENYNDKDYYKEYPTIHHLLLELMKNKESHDVRLVYIAIAWLVAHRGHFLQEIDADSIDKIIDFKSIFEPFKEYFAINEYDFPWEKEINIKELGEVLKQKTGVNAKKLKVTDMFFGNKKPLNDTSETFPYSRIKIVDLLCGGKVNLKDLFNNDAYEDIEELKSFSLNMSDDKIDATYSSLGDDADLIRLCKQIYDWALLADILSGYDSISAAKVAIYNQHAADLKYLKAFVKKYLSDKYNYIFRSKRKDSYAVYVAHLKSFNCKIEDDDKVKDDFLTTLKKLVKEINVEDDDKAFYDDMLKRLELGTFLPLQVSGDNRVIPYQVYLFELKTILNNAKQYLTFLNEVDEDGITVIEKLISIFTFRVPYFVGPLRKDGNPHAWIERKSDGRITPWNFEQKVDLATTEKGFIDRMICRCTYYPGASVLPKNSLLYAEFEVLNEINCIRVNGERISVELKQRIYDELFRKHRKVTYKKIVDFIHSENIQGEIKGIDKESIKSSLTAEHDFKRLLDAKVLTRADVEKIIEHITYTEDKGRLFKWLQDNYSQLVEDDIKYISRLNYKDFGRLSKEFLAGELSGADKLGGTGELTSVIQAMRDTNCNLNEILSDRFTFKAMLKEICDEYYKEHPTTLQDKMDGLYLSAPVKRQVFRTLNIVSDITKACKGMPDRIFIEMARGAEKDKKVKRTKTRKEQLDELYANIKNEDVEKMRNELTAMGEQVDNKLQSEKLFLYYLQLGKCMYSGEPIDINELMRSNQARYNIEHIYPQSKVKDDSITNNKVLVLSKINGDKGDTYPIDAKIQNKMRSMWDYYHKYKLITDEKYNRLIRTTPFSEEEKMEFINRQLVETRQSTKAVASLLRELYPNSTVVYVNAGLASSFRQEFDMLKSRSVNDLHHAKDAYLNIVVGNVWYEKFTKKFFIKREFDDNYNLNINTVFSRKQYSDGKCIWLGDTSIEDVKNVLKKDAIRLTVFKYIRKGALFDLLPVSKAKGLVPRQIKKYINTERYGGYRKSTAAFFIPVSFVCGKRKDIIIMAVESLFADKFLADDAFAEQYARQSISELCGGKEITDIGFPMGKRVLRVNTVLSLDGYRVCITGKSNGGKNLLVASLVPLAIGYNWERYIKRLERFAEKKKNNKNLIIDKEYDKITREENEKLYEIFLDKSKNSLFRIRPNMPIDTIENGIDSFRNLKVEEQVTALLSILSVFSRSGGTKDLSSIGGTKSAAQTYISAYVSNIKKSYSDVRIIECSASGLFESSSKNLFKYL